MRGKEFGERRAGVGAGGSRGRVHAGHPSTPGAEAAWATRRDRCQNSGGAGQRVGRGVGAWPRGAWPRRGRGQQAEGRGRAGRGGASRPRVPQCQPLSTVPVPSGQQEPVWDGAAQAVQLRARPVAAPAAALHLAGLQAARRGAPLPGHRAAAPRLHALALIKPHCHPCLRASLPPRAPGASRPSPRADRGPGLPVPAPGRGRVHGWGGAPRAQGARPGITPPLHTVPSDPRQVGGQGA